MVVVNHITVRLGTGVATRFICIDFDLIGPRDYEKAFTVHTSITQSQNEIFNQ